jgi:dTDP-4-dehydrorhamnose reductase
MVSPFVDLTPRLPLLICGASGVVGYNAFAYFQRRYPGRVIGVRPPQTFRLTGPGVVALDTEDGAGMRRIFDEHGFGSVLNGTGNCALKSCELDPDMARRTNVVSAGHVAAAAREFGCRLIHLSSDLVYSGTRGGNHVETDPVDPVTVYGDSMAEGEKVVRDAHPDAAVLRISLPMGPSFNGHAGAIDWIQSRFRHGRPATLYFDEVRSPTYCDDMNRVFERLLAGDEAGLFHCGGPRFVTLYQIAQIVNRVGGYDPQWLNGCPRFAAGPMPPRAGDVTMNSSKLRSLLGGEPFRPWPYSDELFPTHDRWHWERPNGRTGSAAELEALLYRYPGSDDVLPVDDQSRLADIETFAP